MTAWCRLLTASLLGLTWVLPASAGESPLSSHLIEAQEVKGDLPAAPTDPAWAGVPARTFLAYPQRTVRLNDKRANEASKTEGPEPLDVKAVYNARDLAIWVEWKEETPSKVSRSETNVFGDSVAFEVPIRFGPGLRLPYVGMGDQKLPVRIAMQRAAEDGTLANEYVAAGFGSLTRTSKPFAKMGMTYDPTTKVWRAEFTRPLVAGAHSMAQGLVPIAFAVWEGAASQRGGNKRLSSWQFLKLSRYPVSPAYQRQIAAAVTPAAGSAEKGRQLVTQYCIGCHRFADQQSAQEGFAPDLSSIGAIATTGYIRESIGQPSEVIVPHLNINRHYDKSAKPDRFRAYPNADGFKFYVLDDKGHKASKMPPFSLPKQDLEDIVTYLQTLDGTKE